MKQAQEILDSIVSQIDSVGNGDAVLGSPIKVGSATIYPISRISVGMGGGCGCGDHRPGHGHHKNEGPESGTGMGVGGGAKARPVAVLVIEPDSIRVLPIADKKGKLDQLLEKIPELVEHLHGSSSKCCC